MARHDTGNKRAEKGLESLPMKTVEGTRARTVRGGNKRKPATSKLSEACCKGTHIPEVVVEL